MKAAFKQVEGIDASFCCPPDDRPLVVSDLVAEAPDGIYVTEDPYEIEMLRKSGAAEEVPLPRAGKPSRAAKRRK